MLLAGVFALQQPQDASWGDAGAWRYPVGAPSGLQSVPAGEVPAFKLNRGLEGPPGHLTHTGADLANGRGGDTVRAAASGLVVLESTRDDGYGRRIVIAHRLPPDRIAYTVYAHLAEGSTIVHAGDRVCAGDPIARVGQTGRASTPHLHFEVREPVDPSARWENAPVSDPLPFIDARLASPVDCEPGVAPYVDWARGEGLLGADALAEAPLSHATWWRMLAMAAAVPRDPVPDDDEALRDTLIATGVLPVESEGERPGDALDWKSCARDLKRLDAIGVRMPHGPLADEAHRAMCMQRFDHETPIDALSALKHHRGVPRTADACVLLADVSGPRAEGDLPQGHAGKRSSAKHHRRTHAHHAPKRQKLHARATKHAKPAASAKTPAKRSTAKKAKPAKKPAATSARKRSGA